MKISQTPHPIEAELDEECREVLDALRRDALEHHEGDQNDWLSQIAAHLRLTPEERIERWTSFSNDVLGFNGRQSGIQHSTFRPRRVLHTLSEYEVDVVLVGMGAGYLQGAPYPTYNTDITPQTDNDNIDTMWQALRTLDAQPLERDEWGLVVEPTLPGFHRLNTAAGMVNIVDTLPGVGGYNKVMKRADLMDIGRGLEIRVASLQDVIRSKEMVGGLIVGETPYSRKIDELHVLMCRETLNVKAKYSDDGVK